MNKITLLLSTVFLCNVNVVYSAEFEKADTIFSSKKLTKKVRKLNKVTKKVKKNVAHLETLIAKNTTAIEEIKSTLQGSTFNTHTSYQVTDLNRLRVGEVISISQGGDSALIISDAIQMVVEFQTPSGRLGESMGYEYAEFDCQGNKYANTRGGLFSMARVARNGSLLGYDESTNELVYAPAEPILTEIEVKSFSGNGECYNQDEYNIRTERLYIPKKMPMPESFVWQCISGEQGAGCPKALYLKGNFEAPFYFER